jgi:hypothetical protein
MKGLAQQQLLIIIAIVAVAAGIAVFTQIKISPPQVGMQPIEQPLQVSLQILSAPTTVEAGKDFTISWQINSNKKLEIQHTAVHFNSEPVPDPSSPADYKLAASQVLTGTIPGTFEVRFEVTTPSQTGTVYYRAHAIVEGKHYWSEEKSLTVTESSQQVSPPPSPPSPPATVFTFQVDDSGFKQDGMTVTSVQVPRGEKITFVFNFNDANIYYGGLDIRTSPQIFTVAYRKGTGSTSQSVEFTASSNFEMRAYWPASGVQKGLTVNVIVL